MVPEKAAGRPPAIPARPSLEAASPGHPSGGLGRYSVPR